jgi:hypothetical protein
MTKAIHGLLTICCALALSGCGQSERNVIVGRSPFFHVELALPADKSEAIVGAVRSFAKEKDMDFLLAQKSLEPGDFNASANGPSLNLTAMHVAALAKGVDVFAIASGDPTPQQKALAKEFVERLQMAGSGVREPNARIQ